MELHIEFHFSSIPKKSWMFVSRSWTTMYWWPEYSSAYSYSSIGIFSVLYFYYTRPNSIHLYLFRHTTDTQVIRNIINDLICEGEKMNAKNRTGLRHWSKYITLLRPDIKETVISICDFLLRFLGLPFSYILYIATIIAERVTSAKQCNNNRNITNLNEREL